MTIRMRLKKVNIFSLHFYIMCFLRLYQYIIRYLKISFLLRKKYKHGNTTRVWVLKPAITHVKERNEQIDIFTFLVPEETINWHKDYESDYQYPLLRFDKIKLHLIFNKGIDVIFPWESSRCQFLVARGQNFYNTQHLDYYLNFKRIILNWIKENPFLYGVNWISPMDAAIRATNWIIGCELFAEQFQRDEVFKKEITISVQQHANFIINFKGKIIGNHSVAHFAGLLFISAFLLNKRLQKIAIRGLERCMQAQTFNDGVDREFSTCYHRLVLEMFAFSAILAKANHIKFSDIYYKSLFKMFEYTAAYVDQKGNAPQIGDNDSGRFLIFHDSDENDHSYLLKIGRKIFNYSFLTQADIGVYDLAKWLPDFQPETIYSEIRKTDKSIKFPYGGFYFLKNSQLSITINGNVLSKDSFKGHKHFDFGSFEVSYNGIPVFIELGTYTYTRNLGMRNMFKGFLAHNVVFPENLDPRIYDIEDYFGLGDKWPVISQLSFIENNSVTFNVSYGNITIERNISILANEVHILDKSNCRLRSHMHTRLQFSVIGTRLENENVRIVTDAASILLENCNYSDRYGHISNDCTRIILTNENQINVRIQLI